jgi:hypothetical protein
LASKKWADLTMGKKACVIILGIGQVALLVAALWDLVHRGADEVRGDKRMWAALVFINWIGPIAYFTIGRKRGAGELSVDADPTEPGYAEGI